MVSVGIRSKHLLSSTAGPYFFLKLTLDTLSTLIMFEAVRAAKYSSVQGNREL
jgi:hypothetical protein